MIQWHTLADAEVNCDVDEVVRLEYSLERWLIAKPATVIAISTYKNQAQCCHTASKEARIYSEQSKAGYRRISMTKSSAATLQEEYLNESQKYADGSF